MLKRKLIIALLAAVLLLSIAACTPQRRDVNVTFDANGGWLDSINGEEVTRVVSVKSGEAVARPMHPVKSGETFDWWYTEAEGGERWEFDTAVTEDMTLYAQWIGQKSVRYLIDHDFDGEYTEAEQLSVIPGSKISPLSMQKVTGYRNDLWYTDAALTELWDFNTPVESDLDLYCKLTLIDEWQFENDSQFWFINAEGGAGDGVLTELEKGIKLEFDKNVRADSHIRVDDLMMPLDEREILVVRVKSFGPANSVRAYFTTDAVIAYGQFLQIYPQGMANSKDEDDFIDVRFDMSSIPESAWVPGKFLTSLRIDFPTPNDGNTVIVDSIYFEKKQNADKQGWQFPLNSNYFRQEGTAVRSLDSFDDGIKLTYGAAGTKQYTAAAVSQALGEKNSVVMRYKNLSAASQVKLQFVTNSTESYNESNSAVVTLQTNMAQSDEWAEVEFDLSGVNDWRNVLRSLRLTFIAEVDTEIIIQSIYIEPGNPDSADTTPEVEIGTGWQFPAYTDENPGNWELASNGYEGAFTSASHNGIKVNFGTKTSGVYSLFTLKNLEQNLEGYNIIAVRYKNLSPVNRLYVIFQTDSGTANPVYTGIATDMYESSDWETALFIINDAKWTGTLKSLQFSVLGNGNVFIFDSIELRAGIEEREVDGWQFPASKPSNLTANNYVVSDMADGTKFTATGAGETFLQILGFSRDTVKSAVRIGYVNISPEGTLNCYVGTNGSFDNHKAFTNVFKKNMKAGDAYQYAVLDLSSVISGWETLNQLRFGLNSQRAGDVLIIDSIEFIEPYDPAFEGWRFDADYSSLNIVTSAGLVSGGNSWRADGLVLQANADGQEVYAQILGFTREIGSKKKVEITYINTSSISGSPNIYFARSTSGYDEGALTAVNKMSAKMSPDGAFKTVTIDLTEKLEGWDTLVQFRIGLSCNAGQMLIIKSIKFVD